MTKALEKMGPTFDASAFAAVGSFSAEALGLSKALGSVGVPVSPAFSVGAIGALEDSRRAAESMLEKMGPTFDASAFAVAQMPSVEAILGRLSDDDLGSATDFVTNLGVRPLITTPIEDLVAASNFWGKVEGEAVSAQSELGVRDEAGREEEIAQVAALLGLLLVLAVSSNVVIDITLFSLRSLIELVYLLWQAASHPAFSLPMGTVGGAISLVHVLRSREPDS